MDKISIIIPFHNASKYIQNCIDCLKKQTYSNFEAIFINDESSDDFEKIFDNIRDDRIKLISIKKSGVSKARNIGIDNSTGDYIAFLDVDDEYKEDYLYEMINSIKKYKVDIVICNYIERYSNYEKKIKLPWNNIILDNDRIKKEVLPCMIGKKNKTEKINTIRGLVWRTFIRKEFYDKYKIKFDENVQIAEDLLFLVDLYAKANKMYICDSFLYIYNRFNGTTLDKYISNSLKKQIYFHGKLVQSLKENDIFELNKNRYAMNRMRMYTSTISNIVRNKNKIEINKELKELCKYYKKDTYILDMDSNISFLWKFNRFLLKHELIYIIKIIYCSKEKKRRKKLV